jgi:predicted small secreted protein
MKLIHKFFFIGAVLLLMAQLSGCGETIAGIGKDIKRVGKGVETIFFRENK